jgi:leucyl-tRNA synthetase
VNGKLRDLVSAPTDATRDELEQLARAAPKVQPYLNSGGEVVKTIVVPGKLVNFVVR